MKRALGRLLCALGRHRWRPFGYSGDSVYVVCRRCTAGRWNF